MFTKILIANRGEIACRIIKTAERMGIATVAVYSDADQGALHVKMASEAVYIGPSPASESYLVADKIIAAAKRCGAEAIHPGYGFLSENADFCRLCESENIVFIGPPSGAIESMGSKSAAKSIMEKASVPLVPGYHGAEQDPQALKAIADKMGYPILLKAVAGGGGKGMRPVASSDEFIEALQGAKREAQSSFGNGDVLLERHIQRPRHVEVQVFCDQHGNAVYLFDRDCSIQRRHQKIIEEAPAPSLSEDFRKSMGEAAVRAAQAIGYVGAGTVEFLVEKTKSDEHHFYFMEMNTRLQVEHPVTEMVSGQDLVQWQLKVASGEALPLKQEELVLQGHAFEARIYAEDTNQGFLPSTGTLLHLTAPVENRYVRVDTGVVEGDEVSPFYDPMIAKLVTWGEDRLAAQQRFLKALDEYQIVGVEHNVGLLKRIVRSSAFTQQEVDTHFIDMHRDELFDSSEGPTQYDKVIAALYLYLQKTAPKNAEIFDPFDPWEASDGWRLNQDAVQNLSLLIASNAYAISVNNLPNSNRLVLSLEGQEYQVSGRIVGKELEATVDGHSLSHCVIQQGESQYTLLTANGNLQFELEMPDLGEPDSTDASTNCTAPMNGRIMEILVSEKQAVEKGEALLVMEAMKMEHTVRASTSAVVKKILCSADALVEGGSELLLLETAKE